MIKNHRYAVILAGGSGSRLWPLSRVEFPKQLLSFDGKQSFLARTIDRMSKLIVLQQLCVVTVAHYAAQIKAHINKEIQLFVEPCARNTAPAILMSARAIAQQDPDAVICFAPADHCIEDEDKFNQTLDLAFTYAQTEDALILIGVRPNYAAIEYGYIEPASLPADMPAPVIRFHEKPDLTTAKAYVAERKLLWNTGFVCARASIILEEFLSCATHLVSQIDDYETLPNISFDRAILEKSQRCMVMQADFGWSDIGSLTTFVAAQPDYQHVSMMGARNNMVYSSRTVVLAGVENLCIIDTGDLILVMRQDQLTQTAQIANELQRMGFSEYI